MKKIYLILILALFISLPKLQAGATKWKVDATTTDWTNSSNWSHGVPDGTDNTTILAGGSIYPVIASGVNAVVDKLTINDGASITIESGGTLTVNAAFKNNSGSAGLIIKSDASGTGSLLHNTASVNATVEQYLSGIGQWHIVSPPISNATNNVYYDIILSDYDEEFNSWTNLTEETDPMDVTKGYYAGISSAITPPSSTVTYPGVLNTGSFDITTGFGYHTSTNPDYYGWRLLGNPYPCALDWNADADWSRANLSGWMVIKEGSAWVGWNPLLVGSARSYGGKTDGIIPSTQGFWVRATSSSGVSMTIPASQRVHDTQTFYKDGDENPFPTVRLKVENNGKRDETVVIFHPEGHTGFDGLYDLGKFSSNVGSPEICTVVEENRWAVNIMPEDYTDEVIPVLFKIDNPGIYQIQATEIVNFSGDINVYLEDLKTGTITLLDQNTVYEFSYSPADEDHRFNLHFKDSYFGVEEGTPGGGIFVYSSEDVIYINIPEAKPTEVVIYDMMGRVILSQKITNETHANIRLDAEINYYLVKIQTSDQFITKKVFIK